MIDWEEVYRIKDEVEHACWTMEALGPIQPRKDLEGYVTYRKKLTCHVTWKVSEHSREKTYKEIKKLFTKVQNLITYERTKNNTIEVRDFILANSPAHSIKTDDQVVITAIVDLVKKDSDNKKYNEELRKIMISKERVGNQILDIVEQARNKLGERSALLELFDLSETEKTLEQLLYYTVEQEKMIRNLYHSLAMVANLLLEEDENE